MSGQVENSCFQIGTESEFCPFPRTQQLGPRSRVWGPDLLLRDGGEACTSKEYSMRLPAGRYGWISQGPTDLGELLGVNLVLHSISMGSKDDQWSWPGERKHQHCSVCPRTRCLSFFFSSLSLSLIALCWGSEGRKLQRRKVVVWKSQSYSTYTHLSCISVCKVGKESLYQTSGWNLKINRTES